MKNSVDLAPVLAFLRKLEKNNNRPWFQENKGWYERDVLELAMAFIRAFQPRLKRISSYFVASDRRVGGSLMRVYRDTRFHKDGEPYKTNVGIQFRHEQGRDIHAPGFYVHVAPDECFLAPIQATPHGVEGCRPSRCGQRPVLNRLPTFIRRCSNAHWWPHATRRPRAAEQLQPLQRECSADTR